MLIENTPQHPYEVVDFFVGFLRAFQGNDGVCSSMKRLQKHMKSRSQIGSSPIVVVVLFDVVDEICTLYCTGVQGYFQG
jgi:hypothetical protein